MRATMFKVSVTALLASGAPVFAVTRQQAPAPGPERSRIAEHDRLAERTERASRQHSYDRTSARSAMEIGSRSPR